MRTAERDEETVLAALDLAGARGSWVVSPGVVRGYFDPGAADPQAAFREAWSALAAGGLPLDVSLSDVPDTDWTATWRSAARPVAATPRLWVAPPDAGPPEAGWPPGALVLRIQPGAGFGTGGHATTRALLAWLDGDRGRGPVLDVGTGSGVLAIAAARLGAVRSVGLDLDRDALANAAENRARNGVQDRVALVAGSLEALRPGVRFERVLANLDAATLARLLPQLAARVTPGGRLGAAGLAAGERAAFLARASASGLALLDEHAEADLALGDEWWSGWLTPDPTGAARRPRA